MCAHMTGSYVRAQFVKNMPFEAQATEMWFVASIAIGKSPSWWIVIPVGKDRDVVKSAHFVKIVFS